MKQLFAAIWFFVGGGLLYLGLSLTSSAPLETASLLIGLGVLVGFLKGRFVIAKMGRRAALRLSKGGALYTRRDIILIAAMMTFGMALRIFHVSPLVRGPILVAVGIALLTGAIATLNTKLAAD